MAEVISSREIAETQPEEIQIDEAVASAAATSSIDRSPDQDLVVRLAETLAGPQDRKHDRKSENVDFRFIMGLTNIIEVASLPEEQHNAPNPGNPQPFSDLPSFDPLPLNHEKTTPFPRLRGRQQNPGGRVTAEQIWGNEAATEANILHELLYSTGRLTNSSMQGYQFMTSDDSSSNNVKVGEMIAIRQQNQPLQLGVVRWIKSADGRGIQFGIELLSRTIHVALATFGVNARGKERILFLGKTAGVDTPCSIVLPHAKYRSGTLVEMVIAGSPRYFRLQKLIELSPGFIRYTLSEPRVQ
ncbi:TPA: hypothetical protein EYP38_03760 [Candidatus Micrarchaeota archaeon]|nr:hypothetical protein [Candidatus Micrarchaeota archaeon]